SVVETGRDERRHRRAAHRNSHLDTTAEAGIIQRRIHIVLTLATLVLLDAEAETIPAGIDAQQGRRAEDDGAAKAKRGLEGIIIVPVTARQRGATTDFDRNGKLLSVSRSRANGERGGDGSGNYVALNHSVPIEKGNDLPAKRRIGYQPGPGSARPVNPSVVSDTVARDCLSS